MDHLQCSGSNTIEHDLRVTIWIILQCGGPNTIAHDQRVTIIIIIIIKKRRQRQGWERVMYTHQFEDTQPHNTNL